MNLARDASGAVDEHACYRLAGATALLGRTSHGAHALGLLAGRRLFDARPNRGAAPVSRIADDEAASADIAFVQLPRKLLDVPFPPAMEHHLLDGLRYLLETGRARGARRIAVSIGYESWLGPHDGGGWFGRAVQQLIDEAALSAGTGIQLDVFVIAGNSGDAGVHCMVADPPDAQAGQPRQSTVHWQLPPGSEAPAQIELWMPGDTTALDDLAVVITPPGRASLPALRWDAAVAWPDADAPALCVVMDRSTQTLGSGGRVIVLRLSPTQADGGQGRAAPHGEWSVTLSATQSLQDMAVYIGRGTASMNAPPRGRQASLTRRDAHAEAQDRRGTLNSHGCHPVLQVTTACVSASTIYRGQHSALEPAAVAPYAGIGPTRGARRGPSFGVVVEHGVFHRGHIGIGNRSGTTLRMSGTSVSAPLGARLMSAPVPLVCDISGVRTLSAETQAEQAGAFVHDPSPCALPGRSGAQGR